MMQMHTLGADQFIYDAAGNLTKDALLQTVNDEGITETTTQRELSYDAQGRLTAAIRFNKLRAHYRYNAQNQRIKKQLYQLKECPVDADCTLDAPKIAGSWTYIYDLAGQHATDISRTNSGNIDQTIEYIWLGNLPIAHVQSQIDTQSAVTNIYLTYLHPDHLGTPRQGTDPYGTVIWSWDSDAFGRGNANTDPDKDGERRYINLRFAGQYFDSETGLIYNWNRYYDAFKGRYITSDPIGLDGGINTYSYVGNNPLMYVDPEGLMARPPPKIQKQDILSLSSFKKCICDLGDDCYTCCESAAKVILGRDRFMSSVGVCESLCLSNMNGQDPIDKKELCDDEDCEDAKE